jgi:peptidoglycan/LPS O-acetylase OafA/YrhL
MSNRISNGFLRHIGIASYAMYLLQFAVIHLVTWAWMSTLGHLPSFELGFIAVALISYCLSRYFIAPWIESPAIAFGKKLAHSK